jgi:uncharacterized protein YbjT (DUF2867 family)
MTRGLCLVTGGTGYVGGRLVPLLLERGWQVRVLARHPERLRDREWAGRVDLVAGDAGDPAAMATAMAGVDTAYYLLHSLQAGSRLEDQERNVATTFANAARDAGIRHIVYLGGLAPDLPADRMSAHMRSRAGVGTVLSSSGVPVVELRAAMILGSGSASFEMLRYLTERLPAMVTPRWVRCRTQPIAIRDVLRYLVEAADLPATVSRSFDIGGPDVLTYEQMLQRYARVAGLRRRVILPVNVLTPNLSSHWVGVVTPVPRAIARPLVQSLRHDAICTEHDIDTVIPPPPEGLVPFDEAIRLALTRVRDAQVVTRWSDASVPGAPSDPLPTDPTWTGGTLYEDIREQTSALPPEDLWVAVERIGGEHGWYAAGLLWEIRGVMDRAIGGVGLRRGRRDPDHLVVGDVVDFWRVEECLPPRLLRLRAEMRLPGKAWLEFRVTAEDGGSRVRQRAVFLPRGLAGHAYWWSIAPFHAFVFPPMIRHLVRQAERRRVPSDRIAA